MAEVRAAATTELDVLARALADAFAEDPLLVWLSPPRGYPQRSRHLHRMMLDHAIGFGTVDVAVGDGAEVVGAAVWLPPGHWRVPPSALVRGTGRIIRAGGMRIPRMLHRLGKVEQSHPTSPEHWYLESIGVVRAQQGRGVGSLLLERRVAQFDAQGLPAYLECSNERNIELYERYGFITTQVLTFPSGPPQWLMWRDPR